MAYRFSNHEDFFVTPKPGERVRVFIEGQSIATFEGKVTAVNIWADEKTPETTRVVIQHTIEYRMEQKAPQVSKKPLRPLPRKRK